MSRVFDGVNDLVDFGDNVEHNHITIMAWVRRDANVANAAAFVKDYSDPRGAPFVSYLLGSDGSGAIMMVAISDGSLETNLGSTPSNPVKMHRIMTYDGNETQNWEDGSNFRTDTSPSGNIIYSNGILSMGGAGVIAAGPWDGIICECALWSEDIGDTMVQALARGANPFVMRHDILVFYAPLWGNDDPEPDYKGQLTGTVTGALKGDWHGPSVPLQNHMCGGMG